MVHSWFGISVHRTIMQAGIARDSFKVREKFSFARIFTMVKAIVFGLGSLSLEPQEYPNGVGPLTRETEYQ